MKGYTPLSVFLAVFLPVFFFCGCDSDGSSNSIGDLTAGPGIIIDNQGVIGVDFGAEAGEVAEGNDPRFSNEPYTDADVQDFLDAHGYVTGPRYTDQEAIDAVGPHVTSVDGLSGGTISGNVVVEGDLTVTGNSNLASVSGGFTRWDETLNTEFTSMSDTAEVVHNFTFTTQADPLATAFVVQAELFYTDATCSGGAQAIYRLEEWPIATFSLSWGMPPEDPADTWIAKRGTFTSTLPLTGEIHSIDVELRVYAGCGTPQVKLRNQTLRWYVAEPG